MARDSTGGNAWQGGGCEAISPLAGLYTCSALLERLAITAVAMLVCIVRASASVSAFVCVCVQSATVGLKGWTRARAAEGDEQRGGALWSARCGWRGHACMFGIVVAIWVVGDRAQAALDASLRFPSVQASGF